MLEKEARLLTARLLAGFPGRDAPVGTAALYVEYLVRYPIEVGQNAVKRLIEGSRFLPAVSELHEELAGENETYQGYQRPVLPRGEKAKPMTDEEIREAMAPVRAYLGRRGIGRMPEGTTDGEIEAEVAEKRAKARNLSTGDAA